MANSGSDAELNVRISATTTDAEAKLAIMRERIRALNVETKAFAAEAAATSAPTSEMVAKVAMSATAAKVATSEFKAMGGSLEHTTGSISTATREFRALFDELSSGRTRMTPGTLAIIGQRVLGLSGYTLAAIGVVAGFALGLGYLAVKAIEADNALSRMKLGADFAQNVDISRGAIERINHELESMAGITTASAREIESGFLRLGNMTSADVEAISGAVAEFVQVTGTKAPEAVKMFSKVLDENFTKMSDLEKIFPGISAQEAENFQKVQALGNAHNTLAALVKLTQDHLKSTKSDLIEYQSGWTSVGNDIRYVIGYLGEVLPIFNALSHVIEDGRKIWAGLSGAISGATAWINKYASALNALNPIEQIHQNLLAENAAAMGHHTKVIEDAAAAAARERASGEEDLTRAKKFGEQFARNTDRAKELKDGIALLKKEIATPGVGKDLLADFTDNLKRAQKELDDLNKQKVVNPFKGTGFSNAGDEEIKQAEEAISEIQADETKSHAERVAAIEDMWRKVLASDKLNAGQRLQVQRDLNTEIAGENKRAAAEQQAIARNNATTDIQLARLAVEEKKALLEEEVKAGAISNDQKFAALREFILAEEALDTQAETNAEAAYARDSLAYAEAENRKKIIHARTLAALAQLDRQAETQRLADWKKDNADLLSAEDALVNGIFSRNQSLYATLLNVVDTYLKKMITEWLHAETQKLLFSKTAAATDEALTAGVTATHVTSEVAQTAATVAGESARLATKEAAKVAGSAIDVATGSATIMNDAYKAAAGAYSAVAGIPIIGPILAPIAAGVAFGAVAAFDTLTQMETGTLNVPRNMPAFLHEGEAVVPKPFASGLRETLRSGSVTGNPQDMLAKANVARAADVHLHYNPTINAPERPTLPQMMEKDSRWFIGWLNGEIRSGSLKIAMRP